MNQEPHVLYVLRYLDIGNPSCAIAAEGEHWLPHDAVLAWIGALEEHGSGDGAAWGQLAAVQLAVDRGKAEVGYYASWGLNGPVGRAEVQLLIAIVEVADLCCDVAAAECIGGSGNAVDGDIESLGSGVGLTRGELCGCIFFSGSSVSVFATDCCILGICGRVVVGCCISIRVFGVATEKAAEDRDYDQDADDDQAPLHATAFLLLRLLWGSEALLLVRITLVGRLRGGHLVLP